jgi:hypothetical protein
MTATPTDIEDTEWLCSATSTRAARLTGKPLRQLPFNIENKS